MCVCVSALQLIVLMAKGSFNTCKTEEEIEAAKIYIGQRCCKFFPTFYLMPILLLQAHFTHIILGLLMIFILFWN